MRVSPYFSYLKDTFTRARKAVTLPLSMVTSSRVTSATLRSRRLLAAVWMRGLRQLEVRIRHRLRPHEDRMRRELHREMRTLSTHFRSLIAEERTGRRRRPENREAGRILQLKEDWERKLAAVIRQRVLDTEAKLVAAAFLTVVPETRPEGGLTAGRRAGKLTD